MTNSLTCKAWQSPSVSPCFRDVTGPDMFRTEGYGLVRRQMPLPSAANTDNVRDRPTPSAQRPDRDDDDLRSPMSSAQVDALHALVHARSSAPDARWTRRDRGFDVVWAGTLAVLLALAVVSLDSGEIFVATADHLHTMAAARASAVTATAKQQPVTRQSVTRQSVARQSVARQSSAATSRTM